MASVVANNINNNENSNLDVQLHNSKFVSMLQQTAWVLNTTKNYNANYNDVNNNTKVVEQEDDEEIKQDNMKLLQIIIKKSLMMQLRKVTLLMEQIQLKILNLDY